MFSRALANRVQTTKVEHIHSSVTKQHVGNIHVNLKRCDCVFGCVTTTVPEATGIVENSSATPMFGKQVWKVLLVHNLSKTYSIVKYNFLSTLNLLVL